MGRIATVACGAVMAMGAVVAVGQPASAQDGAPLLSGRLADAKGTVEAGATISVFVEPTASEAMEVGQSITMTPVGTARTDASGRFAVFVDRPVDVTKHADSSGQVNMNVVIRARSGVYETLVQRDVTTTPASLSGASAAKASATLKPARKNIRLDKITRLSTGERAAGVARSPRAGAHGATELTVKVLKDFGGRRTTVGTWYSDMKNVRHRFTYAQAAKSSLGVAVSTTGKAGTFSAGRTKTMSSTATVGFGGQVGRGGWRFNTLFHYQKRHYRFCGGFICTNSYRIEPVSWWGGATRSKAPAYSANRCIPMIKGANWTIKNTAAWTFSNGVEAGGMTVVNLTSKTGFSNAVKHTVRYGSKGRLCGKSAYPGQTPRALRAKP